MAEMFLVVALSWSKGVEETEEEERESNVIGKFSREQGAGVAEDTVTR